VPQNEEDANVDLNDELLCAYLDDELDPATRDQVALGLAADGGARLRLARMQVADRQLKRALPLSEPDHFEAAMTARIQGRVTPAVSWRRSVLPWAAAAAITGVFVGYLLPQGAMNGDAAASVVRLDTSLRQVLEKGHSGDAGSSHAVVLSFEAADARFCRVFRSESGGEGLACREGGEWALVAWDATARWPAEGFRTAGANALVDAAMDALGGQPAMSAPEEAALIEAGWIKQQGQ
jgi:hypothetical protein